MERARPLKIIFRITIQTEMPTEVSTEQQAHSSGGWTLDGEYVPAGKKRGDAQGEASRGEERGDGGEPRCKRRWLGVKGLDADAGC